MIRRRTDGRHWLAGAAVASLLGIGACTGGLGPPSLTTADLGMVAETTQRVLETNRIGESANWSNAGSGNRGTVTPTRTYATDDGRPCREFQQTATVEGRTRLARDAACRSAAGAWQSQNHASLADAILRDDSSASGNYGPPAGVGIGVGIGGRGSGVSVGTGIGF